MKEKYCGTCGDDFSSGKLSVRCRLCMRNYHAACWEKAGGCTTYGCAGKIELEKDKKIALDNLLVQNNKNKIYYRGIVGMIKRIFDN